MLIKLVCGVTWHHIRSLRFLTASPSPPPVSESPWMIRANFHSRHNNARGSLHHLRRPTSRAAMIDSIVRHAPFGGLFHLQISRTKRLFRKSLVNQNSFWRQTNWTCKSNDEEPSFTRNSWNLSEIFCSHQLWSCLVLIQILMQYWEGEARESAPIPTLTANACIIPFRFAYCEWVKSLIHKDAVVNSSPQLYIMELSIIEAF